MTNLFEEANQDHNYNKKVELYKKLLPIVVFCTILFIIIISLKNWYYSRQNSIREDRTQLLINAILNPTDEDLRKETLTSLIQSKDKISDISRLGLLKTYIDSKKPIPEILSVIQESIESTEDNVALNLLKVLYASFALEDSSNSNDISIKSQNYLKSIDDIHPLFLNAQIFLSLHLIKQNDTNAANIVLNNIYSNPKASESIKGQIEAIQNYLKLKGKK
jgi:hypothetical protein